MSQAQTLLQINQFLLPAAESRIILPIEGSMIGKWDLWLEPWIGYDWREVPAWVAEAWYFRQYLSEVEFFEAGPGYLQDPWLPAKEALHLPPAAFLEELRGLRVGQEGSSNEFLARVLEKRTPKNGQLRILCGEVGEGFFQDLLLAAQLLEKDLVETIHLDFYQFPFQLQATSNDYFALMRHLFGAGPDGIAFGLKLNQWTAAGRLLLNTHNWWNAPQYFDQMPPDMLKLLAAADLLVLKGQLNRRRLCEDVPGLRPEEAAIPLPCPLLCL